MESIRVAIVGMGKIARDQHLPAIAGNPHFSLAATVSRNESGLDGIPHFKALPDALSAGPKLDAVILCTPPHVRYNLAAQALSHGMHVFLEKPPGATVCEVDALENHARANNVTLFASWHSRFASGVEPARNWLADRQIHHASIAWREDVRVWHPGQQWIWDPGGFGVFDPGINALSIATRILPRPFFLRAATLAFPANRAAPIAADMSFCDTEDVPIKMALDWRQTGLPTWDIVVETDMGICKLSQGGAALSLPSGSELDKDGEYAGLYAHFATLIHTGRSDVDTSPLQLVADAFLIGQRDIVEPFDW